MKKIFLTLFAGLCLSSCCTKQNSQISIVPYPNQMEVQAGSFDLKGQPFTCDIKADERTQQLASQFSAQVAKISNGEHKFNVGEEIPQTGVRFVVDESLAKEAYKLDITKNGVELRASDFNGFLYGVQSLKQLLPVAIYGDEPQENADWTVPCLTINDAPRFSYRGMHLDVSRHFFSVEEVKRYLDMMAIHKLNVFHWHLTDDQGWRIEIKRYPKLTTVGAQRKGTVVRKDWSRYDNVPYGGFYTQEEVKDIVAYAHNLGIEVVPEIDLPGHMLAALTAYPELGCTGGPYEVWGRWGVSDDVLCPGKEKTFDFIEGVLTEVMELFPSKYVHIGGDECPKVRWEKCPRCQARIQKLGLKGDGKHSKEHFLQSYVTERVGKFLAQHGRRAIGWDEILEGKAPQDAIVMSWRGSEGGIQAAQLGHDVIMTPNSHFYFDFYQSMDQDNEPFAIGGFLPVERVYTYDIAFPSLTAEQQKHILGVQANLWTEYIPDDAQLEYMLLPRLAALAEVQWTLPENKSWDRFISTFRMHDIYSKMGYNFAKHIFGIAGAYDVDFEHGASLVTLSTQGTTPIHYTLDGEEPTENSPVCKGAIAVKETCVLKAKTFREGLETPTYEREYTFNKATARKATLNTRPAEKYKFNELKTILDGYHGNQGYMNGDWVGFLNEPMDITLDMEGVGDYSKVVVESLVEKIDWIFPPHSIEVLTSEDGLKFTNVATLACEPETAETPNIIKQYAVEFPATSARYLRIVAHTVNPIPEWHGARGEKAYMFVGEISVE